MASQRTPPPSPTRATPTGLAPTRRRFLQIVGIGLAAPSVLQGAACGDDDGGDKPITPGEAFFPQGLASGDPRPDSVVLWARAVDPEDAGDLALTLIVSTDEAQSAVVDTFDLVAAAEHDHVVKVKLSGLDPATRYWYRFVYEAGAARHGSRVARTKTAPAADADVPVTLALASCQDFVGRYYNSYAKMLEIVDTLDVVVHVGDYIYETTGDDSFQSSGDGERAVTFADEAGAIAFRDAEGNVTHHAAQSLSNYRDLYKTYRSDRWLQRVHERVPFVFIWDDHEFSDDCWQDSATYFDGVVDEDHQTTRRKDAERAHFEYLPTELGLGADGQAFTTAKTPVDDAATVIYKDFRFGKHVHLVLTDTRSYRPDHLIREDDYGPRIAMTSAELTAGGLDPAAKNDADAFVYPPYVDLDDAALAAYRAPLTAALATLLTPLMPGATAAAVTAHAETQVVGLWSAVEVNRLLAAEITAGTLTALDVSDTTTLPRGATFDHLRFSAGRAFASNGLHARYLVEKQHYEAFAKARYTRDPASQDVLGATQEAWLLDTLATSTATWRLVATSIGMTPMIVDARTLPPALDGQPDTANVQGGLALFAGLLPTPYLLSVDQWDGFPDKRNELLAAMRDKPNCVLLSGDIHSFYATNHGAGTGANGVVELTGGGISSESFKGFVRGVVDGLVAGISQLPTVAATISHLEELLQFTFPGLTWANNDAHGFVTATVGATQLDATMWVAPLAHVTVDAGTDQGVAAAPFVGVTFRVQDGVLTKT